jgi:hypothetical protein
MSKPKVYQRIINFKMTDDFEKELRTTAEEMGVKNLSDFIRGAVYMFQSHYHENIFNKSSEENKKTFCEWIRAAKDHEKYLIAKKFMADFEANKANQSEKEKKLKTIQKNFKKFNVEDK